MPFAVPLQQAQNDFPEYTFIEALTPSEQKAAFHVRDAQGEDLCLKIIAPNYNVDRLQREIRALQDINHPNVVALIEYTYSSTPSSQRHFMIEKFIAGKDLADEMRPGQQWDRRTAAETFVGICDGLVALEEKSIVHRDLKPNNIRLRPDGTPVVIDFGLVRLLELPDLTSTGQGAAIGTPVYFAPEQFVGTKRDIDHRTDLFALGVILFQALIGEHPFYQQGMTRQQLSDAVCSSTAFCSNFRFAALPTQWRLIIGRLLEKERLRRPASAVQVRNILESIGAI
jgi:serine/threonine protein kinase